MSCSIVNKFGLQTVRPLASRYCNYVQCLMFCSIVNKFVISGQILYKFPVSDFTEILPVGTALIHLVERTDGYDATNSPFSWLCRSIYRVYVFDPAVSFLPCGICQTFSKPFKIPCLQYPYLPFLPSLLRSSKRHELAASLRMCIAAVVMWLCFVALRCFWNNHYV